MTIATRTSTITPSTPLPGDRYASLRARLAGLAIDEMDAILGRVLGVGRLCRDDENVLSQHQRRQMSDEANAVVVVRKCSDLWHVGFLGGGVGRPIGEHRSRRWEAGQCVVVEVWVRQTKRPSPASSV